MSLPANTQIGDYRILAPLGAGGMGEVYSVEDRKLRRRLALKLLPTHFTKDAGRVVRFTREARAASALNHPNIVTIFEIGQSEHGHFIVMELVDGRTVRRIIDQGCSIAEISQIGRQIAQGLAVAHKAGITHRDIKPENIMVRHDGYVKLLDFGLVLLTLNSVKSATDSGAADTASAPGNILGTPQYMSPEQARGIDVSNATDIFSLGLVLYELATGQHPFGKNSPISVLQSIVSDTPLIPSSLNAEIPAGWDELLLMMLNKDARLRPTAVQVEQELTALGDAVVPDKTHRPQPIKPARHTVGHFNERDRLRAGFAVAESGTGLMLCVSGEPGAGKTTLVEDFLAEVQANSGCRIAHGRCSERLAGTEAYLPWLEALDNLMHSRNESAARVFKGLAPAWYQQIVPLSADDSWSARLKAEAAPSQERLKRELASLLQELSRVQSLVLFFEDLQWADASTVDLLSFLADRFTNLRLLIVCTYRPSDLQIAKHPFAQLKQGLQARGVCQEIPLEFLSCADVEQYLQLVFPGHQFPAELAARIHAKTEGSPLFMADLVRYLRDRKVIVEEQGHWVLGQPLNEIDRDLPASVRAMIEVKMAQLSEEDLRLLVSASVQGYEFDSAVVAEALPMDTAEVEERLEKLERVYGFVRIREEREFPDHTLTLRCRFVHVLYQNTLYSSLRPTRRAQLAARMAGALERFWGQRSKNVANELALLFEVARDFARAADYFRTAARNAGELFASQEAVKLARRALAMTEMLPETPERLERELSIQILLANALIATLGYGAREVDQAFGRARQLCQIVGETTYMLPALWGLSAFHIMKAHYAETLALGRDFLNVAERKNDDGIVVAHRVIGQALLFTGKLAQAREHFERIVSRYVPARHQPLVWLYAQEPGMAGRALLGLTLWLMGYPDQALVHSEESLRLGTQVLQANSQANALVWAAIHHVFRRESQRVRELAQSLDKLANEQGLRFWIAVAMLQYGWAIAEQGGAEEGIAKLDRGIAAFRTAGAELVLTFNFGLLAAAYGKAGQIQRGLATLDEALNLVSRNGETFWEAELHRLRGELLLMEGRSPAEVEPMFQLAIDSARQQEAKSLELRAAMSMSRIWMQQGKRAEARARLRDAYSWFTEGFQTADLQEAEKLLQQLSS